MIAAAIVAVSCAQLMSGSVKLDVKSKGSKIGTAQVSFRITNQGSKFNQSKMEIEQNGAKVTVVQESEYLSDGTPVRSFLRTVLAANGKLTNETVTMIFSNGAANVTVEKDGKTEVKKLTPQAGSEIRRKDEFWFFNAKPTVGQTFICRNFDPNTVSWVQLTSKYIGPEQVTLGKLKIRAHHIRTSRYDYWVDEKGSPVVLKVGEFTMERE